MLHASILCIQVTRVLGNTVIPGTRKLGQMNTVLRVGQERRLTEAPQPFIDPVCMSITIDDKQIIVSYTNQQ